MAKTRRSRKAAGGRKRGGTARKRSSSRTKKAARARSLDLGKLKADLDRALSGLERRGAARTYESPAIAEARARLTRWMADIDDICTEEMQEICGPTMAIPLS